jgi:hypothetical protein
MLIPTTVLTASPSGMTLVQEISVPAGGQATIDFQSIPQSYRHLEIRFRARIESGAAGDGTLRFNNDSGANYFVEVIRGVAGLGSAATLASVTSGNIFSMPDTDDTFEAYGVIKVNYYCNGTFQRSAFSEYCCSASSGTNVGQFMAGWTGSDAVTSIQLTTSTAADFKEGSIFSLYGIT